MEWKDAIKETKFKLLKAILDTLHAEGDILDGQLEALLVAAVERYQPLIGQLEVNSIAREKGYKG